MVVGARPMVLTDLGRAHPVFATDGAGFDIAHWHGDTFDPVPGAVALAGSDEQPHEVFELGSALGVLTHPEVDAATFEHWAQSNPAALTRSGRTLEQLAADDLPRLRRAAPRVRAFLDHLATHLRARTAAVP
jgi:GMP synthase (glutamine-hydrolysing)